MYINKNLWINADGSRMGGFGEVRLIPPQRIMWETPFSIPMSVTRNDTGSWAGFGESGSGEDGIGSFVLGALGLVILGGVVIWVVRSVRK